MSDADRYDFMAMLADYDLAKYADALREGARGHGEGHMQISEATFPVTVRESPIHGLGAFATRPLAQGQIAFPAVWNGHRTRPGWFTNHGYDPCLVAVLNGLQGDVDYVARRPIQAGEEMTLDYRQMVRLGLAYQAGVEPHELTHPQIRGALLRLWVQNKCPL